MGRKSTARDRILSAASLLFHERGYHPVGVAELCSAASVNKGSFYYFFPSKRKLLLEVLSQSWDETGILESWEDHVPPSPTAELRRYFRELFACHYANWETTGYVNGSFLGNLAAELSSTDKEAVTAVKSLLARQQNAFTTVIDAGCGQGELSTPDSTKAATTLVACIHGLLMLAKIQNNLSILPTNESSLLRLAGKT